LFSINPIYNLIQALLRSLFMRRSLASVVSSVIVLALPFVTFAQNQPVMVECRDLAASDNFLGPNETLINGKACRPAGSSITVNLTNTTSVAKAASKTQPAVALPPVPPVKDNLLPAAPVPAAPPVGPVVIITLEDSTPIKLVLSETLSSASAVTGQTVSFETVDDIYVGGVLVIPRMSTAWGTVTEAQGKRRMGRGGKLDLNIDKVRLADGQKAMLRAVREGKGGGHTGAMTGAIVATSLIVWPAAPLFLLMHGKDITMPKGTPITAFINGDVKLDESKFAR
jgi:hypothetical protein